MIIWASASRAMFIPDDEDADDVIDDAGVFDLMPNLSVPVLRHPTGSIALYRSDLSHALDWLFCRI